MGFLRAAHGWKGGVLFALLPKICHTYAAMIKLDTVIPYLRKTKRICGYVVFKRIANCNNIVIVNPLNLMINKRIGHFEEKKWT